MLLTATMPEFQESPKKIAQSKKKLAERKTPRIMLMLLPLCFFGVNFNTALAKRENLTARLKL